MFDSVAPVVTTASADGRSGYARPATAAVTSRSSSLAAGAWSHESIEGLSVLAVRSAAAATASEGACRWAAQSGSAGSAAPAARARTTAVSAASAPVPSSGSTLGHAARTARATASGPPAGTGPPRSRAPAAAASNATEASRRTRSGPSTPPAKPAAGSAGQPSGRAAPVTARPACSGLPAGRRTLSSWVLLGRGKGRSGRRLAGAGRRAPPAHGLERDVGDQVGHRLPTRPAASSTAGTVPPTDDAYRRGLKSHLPSAVPPPGACLGPGHDPAWSRPRTTASAAVALSAVERAARKSVRCRVTVRSRPPATTVAVRGTSRSRAISPKPSPGPMVRRDRPCTETTASPSTMMM